MRPRHAHPGYESGQPGGVDEPRVRGVVADQKGDEARGADRRGDREGGNRHAAGVRASQESGGVSLTRKGVEHAGGGVQARVSGREDRREDDGVDDGSRRGDSRAVEDQGEGGVGDVGFVVAQEVRVHVGDEESDDRDGPNVKEQDAPEDRSYRLRDGLLGVLGFPGGDGHKFRALEGKARDHEDGEDSQASVDERRFALGPVLEARGFSAHDPEDDEDAEHEKDNDGDHLDEGEPEFALAVGAGRKRVEQDEEREEYRRPHPPRGVPEPELHDERGGRELCGHGDRPVEPEVPPGGEAEAGADEAGAVLSERAGHGKVRGHLAEGLHEEEHHEADESVGHDRAAGPRLGNRLARGEEQTCSNRPADCDHRQVAAVQSALQTVVVAVLQRVRTHRRPSLSFLHPAVRKAGRHTYVLRSECTLREKIVQMARAP